MCEHHDFLQPLSNFENCRLIHKKEKGKMGRSWVEWQLPTATNTQLQRDPPRLHISNSLIFQMWSERRLSDRSRDWFSLLCCSRVGAVCAFVPLTQIVKSELVRVCCRHLKVRTFFAMVTKKGSLSNFFVDEVPKEVTKILFKCYFSAHFSHTPHMYWLSN